MLDLRYYQIEAKEAVYREWDRVQSRAREAKRELDRLQGLSNLLSQRILSSDLEKAKAPITN